MKKLEMCEGCKKAMIELLDERIRRTLAVAHEEERDLGSDENAEMGPVQQAEAECFHFMELQRILRGEPTCGVYDDFGKKDEHETAR